MRALLAVGFALAMFGAFAMEATAQTSCSGKNATCRQRCGQAQCPYCTGQFASCKRTGCWTDHQNYGGQTHCNLKKS